MSAERYCTDCGVELESKEHKETCQLYLKQWSFVFEDGMNRHVETYYGNTLEQAKADMLKFYQDAVKDAEELGIENSPLMDGLYETQLTGEVIKFG